MNTRHIPKAELHVHLEGAIPVATIKHLAAKNGVQFPKDFIIDGHYQWQGFPGFLESYDTACEAIQTEEDFAKATYDYLIASAKEGVRYSELIISPTHADRLGLGYEAYLRGIVHGCEQAEAECNLVARLIVTLVRHESHNLARKVIDHLEKHPHARVVGFNIAGNEDAGELKDFKEYFRLASQMGLGLTAHAGEIRGPDEIRAAIDELGVTRIGHGVRACEDEALMQRLAKDQICLEVCPSSNVAIAAHYSSYAQHPLRKLFDAGIPTTINSDDPPFFATSIGREYQVAHDHFSFSDEDLRKVTQTAYQFAFIDDPIRAKLLSDPDLAK